MKNKLLLAVFTFLAVAFAFAVKPVKAGNSDSTSNWMPQNYILSGYEIPTAMEYDETSVTFKGSLNAGIATTGFNYLKPINLNDFQIDIDFVVPSAEKLAWICFCFLDTNLMADDENQIAPVAMPFNAMSGKGGYSNTLQTGLVWQFDTTELADGFLKFNFDSKNIDSINGGTGAGWNDQSQAVFEGGHRKVAFDGYNAETGAMNIKFQVSTDDNGLVFNFNNGGYKVSNDGGETYTVDGTRLNGNGCTGLKEYFEENDCYFSVVLMYTDDHRAVSMKVKDINEKNPSDNKEPSYLAPKTVESGNIKATISKNAIGAFGVYPSAVDSIVVNKYDEEDGDYETVKAKETALGASLVDYFKVIPQVGDKKISLTSSIEVAYTLPTGYDDFKAYYINEDDEVQAVPASFVSVEDGVMTVKVDNETISKVVIYGLTNAPTPGPTDDNPTGGAKKGCKSSMITLLPITLGALGVLALKRRNEE